LLTVKSCDEKLVWNWHCKVIWIMHGIGRYACAAYICLRYHGDLVLLHDILVWGVVRIDLIQVVDLGSDVCACLFMCRGCLRRNVVDDGLKLGSGRNWGFRTKFREELRSYRSRMSYETFGLENDASRVVGVAGWHWAPQRVHGDVETWQSWRCAKPRSVRRRGDQARAGMSHRELFLGVPLWWSCMRDAWLSWDLGCLEVFM
jgi:hypothetical protein